MTTVNELSLNDFKQVVRNAPLFAIDIVALDEFNRMLLGKRIHAPAKGFWFVPGGRIYKNESLDKAFSRISEQELGVALNINQATQLGLYDHFYKDSFFGEDVSTHYINATHVFRLEGKRLELPDAQHSDYRWFALDGINEDPLIHKYSKIFLSDLNQWLKHND